ncbi:MAG: hypothetical protein Q8S33_10635 [Myxococcales bacterium]|nr:hypothetical protein [Myxococcales bacterium]
MQRVAGVVVAVGALAAFVLLTITNLTPDPKRFLALSDDGLCEVYAAQLGGTLVSAAVCGLGVWWLAGASAAARLSSIGVVAFLVFLSWMSLQPDAISSLGAMAASCPIARLSTLSHVGVLFAFGAAVLAWPAPSTGARGASRRR